MTHSPTPWSYDLGEIFDCCHNPIIFNFKDGEVSHADAAFICKAVNAPDDLVAALKAADEVFQRMLGADYPTPPGSAPALVKAALAKAGA